MEKGKIELIITMTDEELAQTNANVTANFQEDASAHERHIDLETLVTVQIEQVCRKAERKTS